MWRALAWNTYVREQSPSDFRYRSVDESGDGRWLVSSKRTAEREHRKLREAVQLACIEAYDPSITESLALEILENIKNLKGNPKTVV